MAHNTVSSSGDAELEMKPVCSALSGKLPLLRQRPAPSANAPPLRPVELLRQRPALSGSQPPGKYPGASPALVPLTQGASARPHRRFRKDCPGTWKTLAIHLLFQLHKIFMLDPSISWDGLVL